MTRIVYHYFEECFKQYLKSDTYMWVVMRIAGTLAQRAKRGMQFCIGYTIAAQNPIRCMVLSDIVDTCDVKASMLKLFEVSNLYQFMV